MESQKELTQAKIDVRYHSRELIKVVFIVTEDFPARDVDGIGPILRKKSVGNFLIFITRHRKIRP